MNILLITVTCLSQGLTGNGKSYIACALGMEACKHYYNTKYVRLPDLLIDLKVARENGTYKKVLAKYANPTLLTLDERLLMKPTTEEQTDIFELLHRRRKRSSTIFCSQYTKDGWYEQLEGDASPLADAILDRIVHEGYVINIVPVIHPKLIPCERFMACQKLKVCNCKGTKQVAPPHKNIRIPNLATNRCFQLSICTLCILLYALTLHFVNLCYHNMS